MSNNQVWLIYYILLEMVKLGMVTISESSQELQNIKENPFDWTLSWKNDLSCVSKQNNCYLTDSFSVRGAQFLQWLALRNLGRIRYFFRRLVLLVDNGDSYKSVPFQI